MQQFTDYKIIQGHACEVKAQVNVHLEMGYVPIGGLATSGNGYFSQAVAKPVQAL